MEDSSRNGFLYDTSLQSLALGSSLNCTLENPSGLAKRVIVEEIVITNTISTFMYATFLHMPTTNTPTSTSDPIPYVMPVSIASPGNAGLFKVQNTVSAMSGGTQICKLPMAPMADNRRGTVPFTLLPGVKVGVNISATLAASVCVAVYTREEVIA